MSFLYVIAAKENPQAVKLGFSASPEKRVKQLQTGARETLTLYHAEEVADDRVKVAERALHRLLGHKRLAGEWFDVSVEEAIAEVMFIRITEDVNPNVI